MKKSKHPSEQSKAGAAKTASARAAVPEKTFRWWPWAAFAAALLVAMEAYGPALHGDFVLDDLYLPYGNPKVSQFSTHIWLSGTRPVLLFSYWLNYMMSGVEPYLYHVTNVVLHTVVAGMIAIVTAKLLEWTAVAGRARWILSIFAGGLFLLHPLQTESVAYVASRSEVLSVLFYFGAFAVFLYRPEGRIPWVRSILCAVLLLIAVNTKEHTLTLPVLLLASSMFWHRGSAKFHAVLFGLQAVVGAIGAYLVVLTLKHSNTAGFNVRGFSPAAYFFTQCRVIWMYIRLFFLPAGQNVDPDIPISVNLMQHGAMFGLLGLAALLGAAWFYRKRWPLAAFGVFTFLLLLAPTSSFIPIQDVYAERRMYLPFLGLVLVLLEFMRRLDVKTMLWTAASILIVCTVLTYQRSAVWASPTALWTDTVAKSPRKLRPRFQLAYAQYATGHCPEAVGNYQIASQLAPPDYLFLVDWSNALYCAGQNDEAIGTLNQAVSFRRPSEAYLLLGAIYAKTGRMPEALQALAQAEKIDPSLAEIYVNRGNIYLLGGDHEAAIREYQRGLKVDPANPHVLEALSRAGGR